MKPLPGKRGKALDSMRTFIHQRRDVTSQYGCHFALALEHCLRPSTLKINHKKTRKRMTAVREGNKLEKEGFAEQKPRQSKTTEGGGKNKEGERQH